MKFNLGEDKVVIVMSETPKEATLLFNLVMGNKSVTDNSAVNVRERVTTKDAGAKKGKYRKACPICGIKKKNLANHIIFAHDRQGKTGWHISGVYPSKNKAQQQVATPHPELI